MPYQGRQVGLGTRCSCSSSTLIRSSHTKRLALLCDSLCVRLPLCVTLCVNVTCHHHAAAAAAAAAGGGGDDECKSIHTAQA